MIFPQHTIGTTLMANISLIIGGFIATYFTKDKKIIYGFYVGIGIIISVIFTVPQTSIVNIVTVSLMTIIITTIGAIIAKKINPTHNQ